MKISNRLGSREYHFSTIQRRMRNIFRNGLVSVRIEPNFRRIGVKKGLYHVYLKTGELMETGAIILKWTEY